MIAIWIELAGVKAWLQTFIDEEDFEFPETMNGTVGVEIRQHAALKYEVRFAIEEAIQLVPAQGQESITLSMDADPAPGGLVLDGAAETIIGDLAMTQIAAGLPWQMVVDIFWDGEGHDEWVCEPNDSGGEDCGDKWVDGPESPEVEGTMNLVVPGPTASIHVDIATDTFGFVNLSLGDDTLVADVDGDPIVQLELNADAGWLFDLTMVGENPTTTRFEMTPGLDVQLVFSMDHVKDGLQDPSDFILSDTLGARLDGDTTPAITLVRLVDKFDFMVSAGQLTLWSDSMDGDIVVGTGQCLDHDDEGLTDEEKDALHGVFGGLYAGVCGEE
jgi:hypothetical protein